jgi:hypothetical protein
VAFKPLLPIASLAFALLTGCAPPTRAVTPGIVPRDMHGEPVLTEPAPPLPAAG